MKSSNIYNMKKTAILFLFSAFALTSLRCSVSAEQGEQLSQVNETNDSESHVQVISEEESNPPSNDEASGIIFFEGTWKEALAKAKAENKLIFLDAYASWCGPCKKMAANVFTDHAVGKVYNEKFINVKMDMEKGEGVQLSQQLDVRSYPSFYFIDGSGAVKKVAIGYHPASEFIQLGNAVN